MTLPKDDIIWAWNTSQLSASQIGRRFGVTRNVILSLVRRDPRASPRRPPTPMQIKDRRIKALEAEVQRLRAFEVNRSQSKRVEWKASQ